MNDYGDAYRVKFSQLDKVLTALGFVRRDTPKFTAYREAKHDALIILRKLKDDDIVGDPYLVGVRSTIIGKGVASDTRLRSLLNRSGKTPQKSLQGILPTKARKSLADRKTSRPANEHTKTDAVQNVG